MGVLNVTPDSFSDGGRFADVDAARDQARRMIEAGADLIDIGGESTRPGAAPVTEALELDRVLPVIAAIPAIMIRSRRCFPSWRRAPTRRWRPALRAIRSGSILVSALASGLSIIWR
jgi:dihydropteroate synthase